MHPQTTFELRITPCGKDVAQKEQAKAELVAWLLSVGCTAFVEGALDCDVDHDYDDASRNLYQELDGDTAPLSLYRYNREELDDLQTRIASKFAERVALEMLSHPTSEWMEGWKESFRPFTTKRFYVRPPWCDESDDTSKMDLVIEPGMAFGTGQHATTQLCLAQIEGVAERLRERLSSQTVLDVGTGTGILAIACHKLGFGAIAATDIEADAVTATLENTKMNRAQVAVAKGSVVEGEFDLVVANILSVVLRKLMPDLAGAVTAGGHLLLSGILAEEETEMRGRIEEAGLTVVGSEVMSGWTAILGSKP